MAANLVRNIREPLERFPVSNWLDSTVALHWIWSERNYKQFFNKIQQKNVEWRYIPTHENRADLGRRGGAVTENNELNRRAFYTRRVAWKIKMKTAKESLAEASKTWESFQLATEQEPDAFMQSVQWTYRWKKIVDDFVNLSTHREVCAQREDHGKETGPLTTYGRNWSTK